MADDYDAEDDDRDDAGPGFPGVVRVAGIIWLLFGTVGVLGSLVQFAVAGAARAGPGVAAGGRVRPAGPAAAAPPAPGRRRVARRHTPSASLTCPTPSYTNFPPAIISTAPSSRRSVRVPSRFAPRYDPSSPPAAAA